MYPTADHIYDGIFVKEQIEYLTQKYSLEHQIEFINVLESKINYIKSIYRINKLIRQKKFDIVHIHFGLSGIFLLFNPFIDVPTIVTLHGSDTIASKSYGLILKITRLVVNRVNRVIILNDRMESLFSKHSNKLVKIPCGININSFDVSRHNNDEIFRLGFPSDKNRPEKNFILFQKIINLFIAENLKIEFIEFHNLTREQVIENLSTLDCLLMTSLNEGSPQIIKEAMAAGVPIVSTNVGDVKYVLNGVTNCSVVDSFDPERFVEPIKKLMALRNEQRITNGKSRVEELQLDQDSVVSKIYNTYKEIITANKKKN